mmetsp:Transcript_8457/g.31249  ORF Transcript_8457/g.31249 Transcript_8457/m.31249 type:complete len:124 (+) Transcript_8457:241-612(+)
MSTFGQRNSNRAPLFAGTSSKDADSGGGFDSMTLEQENDRGIEHMADRVQALKRVTLDINEEVDAHNKLLEKMGMDMDGAKGLVGGTMDKMKKMMETPSNRFILYVVGASTVLFLLVYFLRSH